MQQNGLMEILDRSRHEQLELCDMLEVIADSLPGRVDRGVCAQTAKQLAEIVARAHDTEEVYIFPRIAAAGPLVVDSAAMIEQLRNHHLADAFLVEELVEVLMSYEIGAPLQGPEATGYMLRGFFGGLRRHLALEHELFGVVLGQIDKDRQGP